MKVFKRSVNVNANLILRLMRQCRYLQMYPPPHVTRCHQSSVNPVLSRRSRGIERCSARLFAFSSGIIGGSHFDFGFISFLFPMWPSWRFRVV